MLSLEAHEDSMAEASNTQGMAKGWHGANFKRKGWIRHKSNPANLPSERWGENHFQHSSTERPLTRKETSMLIYLNGKRVLELPFTSLMENTSKVRLQMTLNDSRDKTSSNAALPLLTGWKWKRSDAVQKGTQRYCGASPAGKKRIWPGSKWTDVATTPEWTKLEKDRKCKNVLLLSQKKDTYVWPAANLSTRDGFHQPLDLVLWSPSLKTAYMIELTVLWIWLKWQDPCCAPRTSK